MRSRGFQALFAACVAYLPVLLEARNIPNSLAQSQPKVVGFPMQRRAVPNPVQRDRLRRRAGTFQASLDNGETLYFLDASIGTPPQKFQLHLDTGSSDLWVNANSSAFCQQASEPCDLTGSYVANASSTYEYVGSYFEISYVDGSQAKGDYVTDTLTIGNLTLDHLQFGIGYESSTRQGILGIGYPINEVQVGRAKMDPYDNLPAALVSAGRISRNAFSLWLNDLNASNGNILFGGIDTARFKGPLQTLPIQASHNVYSEFLITLTGLKLGSHDIATDVAVAALLDSGSSLTYLPDDMAHDIFSYVSAQYDDSAAAAYVSCSLAQDPTVLNFTFTSPTISVPMSELVFNVAGEFRRDLDTRQSLCLFGIAPAGAGSVVLGDTFLRSAYVVYDVQNNQISLAQTNFGAWESNIQEIPSGTGIPGATVVSNPVKATSSSTSDNGNSTDDNSVTGNGSKGDDGGSAASVTAPVSSLVVALVSATVAVFVVLQ